MKFDIEQQINREEAKLSTSMVAERNIEHVLNEASNALFHLDELYINGNTKQKREIVGSIYPKKLVFQNTEGRTNEVAEVLSLIYLINKELKAKKMGQKAISHFCPVR